MLSVVMTSAIILRIVIFYCYAECHYAECHYVKCQYAEQCIFSHFYAQRHYAECFIVLLSAFRLSVVIPEVMAPSRTHPVVFCSLSCAPKIWEPPHFLGAAAKILMTASVEITVKDTDSGPRITKLFTTVIYERFLIS